MPLDELISYARGDKPADLLLTNGRVVNVLSGEIVETDVALLRSRIVGLGAYEANEVIDLEGAYLAPGLIDAHVHIESSLVPPAEFSRAVVPRGTTTVVTDPHEIANVLGLDGIRFMFESAKKGPLSMFVMASSCVPATHMETNGAFLRSYDLASLKSDPWVLGLAEVMNFPAVVASDPEVLEKIAAFEDRVLDAAGAAPAGPEVHQLDAGGGQVGGGGRRVVGSRKGEELGHDGADAAQSLAALDEDLVSLGGNRAVCSLNNQVGLNLLRITFMKLALECCRHQDVAISFEQ